MNDGSIMASSFEYDSKFLLRNEKFLRTAVFGASLLIYFCAKRIVRQVQLFYAGSAIVGVFASLVLLAFALQKFTPSYLLPRPFNYGGWPFCIGIYMAIYRNFWYYLYDYRSYVSIYLLVVTIVSFAVCYRWGPPSDIKTLNLLQWFIQLCALTGIYFSSTSNELAYTIIAILVTFPYLKEIWYTISYWKARISEIVYGPSPRKLLSEKEYEEEALQFTKAELRKLKSYCQEAPSPLTWKIMSRLSNPSRMASFVNGDAEHVTRGEMDSFLRSFDDENEVNFEESEELGYQNFPTKIDLRGASNAGKRSSLSPINTKNFKPSSPSINNRNYTKLFSSPIKNNLIRNSSDRPSTNRRTFNNTEEAAEYISDDES